MDYRYLKAFLLTARHLNFSKAALELRIAQSAVSRQIRLLEEAVGCQLLVRTKKSVVLTPEGLKLFQRAQEFETWTHLQFNEAARPQLRIGALSGVVDSFLISKFVTYENIADINLHLVTSAHAELEGLLQRQEIDISLSYRSSELSGAISKKLYAEKLVLISKRGVDMRTLHNQCWIHMGAAKQLKRLSRTESQKQIVVNSLHSVLTLVQHGLGVAVVPFAATKKVAAAGATIVIQETDSLDTIYLNYLESRLWSKKVENFLRYLKN